MHAVRAVPFVSLLCATAAFAQPSDPETRQPCVDPCTGDTHTPSKLASTEPAQPVPPATAATTATDDDGGWHAPPGKRFVSGFRLGWMYINGINTPNPNRPNGESMAMQYGLRSPNMFVLGYEGFYRVVGHSWLNVLMVGNISVAGLDQSKFIPTASGLLGFEFQRSFELGVGVNLTPDAAAISHVIVAAGWAPMIGSIQTPIHGFFIPDADGNYRVGATVGMNW
jgi:hypothetical protein